MNDLKIPNHVGLIVDGNGRWAKERGMIRSKGHDAGFKRLKEITNYMFTRGVKYISAYVFSTENFKRDKQEVDHLMNLFVLKFKEEQKSYAKNNIKVIFSGSKSNLREDVIKTIEEVTNGTKDNTGGVMNFCLNYGSRAELVNMVKQINEDIVNNNLDINNIDEETLKHYMHQDLPDIDFLIRTSGEQRLSNFMLYQLSYAELYFPKTYFPDFTKEEFEDALLVYNKRDRRFGGIKK